MLPMLKTNLTQAELYLCIWYAIIKLGLSKPCNPLIKMRNHRNKPDICYICNYSKPLKKMVIFVVNFSKIQLTNDKKWV